MEELVYFDIYGKAEAIRMLLWHAKVPFVDTKLSREEFYKQKQAKRFPSDQVPIFISAQGKVYN